MKFTSERYNKYDPIGKKASIEFLNQYDYQLIDDTEAYGSHDLIFNKAEKPVKVEAEISTNWKRETGWEGYQTFHIPGRKAKSKADLYLRFNHNQTAVAVAPMPMITKAPIIHKTTRFSSQPEPFLEISSSQIQIYVKQGTSWIKLKSNLPNYIE